MAHDEHEKQELPRFTYWATIVALVLSLVVMGQQQRLLRQQAALREQQRAFLQRMRGE